MNKSNLSIELFAEFHNLTRKLTFATIALVCLGSIIFWQMEIQVVGKNATTVGVMFMLLALFTFKIPKIIYKYLLSKYRNEPEKRSILGDNWTDFRDRAMQRN